MKPVVYETEDFLVLNKPEGVRVHITKDDPANIAFALEALEKERKATTHFFPCHRLDKDTQGLLIIAKNQSALQEINALFQQKKVKKTYRAICEGNIAKDSEMLEIPMMREGNKTIAGSGKITQTEYEVLERKNNRTLVEIQLHTGFTHQIRAAFAHIGHPIVGDAKYGTPGQLQLFATGLQFEYKGLHTIALKSPIISSDNVSKTEARNAGLRS